MYEEVWDLHSTCRKGWMRWRAEQACFTRALLISLRRRADELVRSARTMGSQAAHNLTSPRLD